MEEPICAANWRGHASLTPVRAARHDGQPLTTEPFLTVEGYETADKRTYSDRAARNARDGNCRRQRDPSGRWETLIGQVEVLSLTLHPRSNWRDEVSGAQDVRRWIEAAMALARAEQPYVTGKGRRSL